MTIFMVFLIASCQQDDSELPQINQETRRIVSAEDIPDVTSTMLQKMGLGRGDNAFSVNQGDSESQLKVNWDQIKQLIDSTGRQTYAFGIEDYDDDPYTFYNLVFKISEHQEAEQPYLLRYTLDEAFIPEFQETGSLQNFKGTITKVLLRGQGNNLGGSVYDDDGEEVVLGDDCPNTSTFTGHSTGNNTTGGGFVSGNYGTTGDRCVTELLATDWYSQACSRSTGECEPWKYMETTYEYVTRCGDGLSTTSERIDDTGCDSDDGSIPVILPEYQILKDASFLNTKADCVFEKLNGGSTGFRKMIQKFDGEFPVAHLRFSVRNDLESSVAARTYVPVGNTDTPDYVITISFNGGTSQAGLDFRPTLLRAKDFAHETVHAEMYRKLMSLIQSGSIQNHLSSESLNQLLQNGDFPGIYDYYRRFGKGFQHEQMAAHYVKTISDIMKEFDNGRIDDGIYNDLAWEGLKGTTAFDNLSEGVKTRINNNIESYIRSNYGDECN